MLDPFLNNSVLTNIAQVIRIPAFMRRIAFAIVLRTQHPALAKILLGGFELLRLGLSIMHIIASFHFPTPN